jgi:hypothetical protein
MAYHEFRDEETGDGYGSFEVFKIDKGDPLFTADEGDMVAEPGFYWWPCFPGCLPDGDASGPFASEQDAINDAQES